MLVAQHVIQLVASVPPHVQRDCQSLRGGLAAKTLHQLILDHFNASNLAGHGMILFAVVPNDHCAIDPGVRGVPLTPGLGCVGSTSYLIVMLIRFFSRKNSTSRIGIAAA
jgi:hypothetical protein